jgi:hypothetical protein
VVEVGVGPAEGDLDGVMKGGQRAVAADQDPQIMGLICRIQTWS